MKQILTFFLLLILTKGVYGQETVGLLFHSGESTIGYTLFSPEGSPKVFLINNCGEKVHEWTCSANPKLTSYLLEDGTLLRSGLGIVEKFDWDSNLIWSVDLGSLGLTQHHDIEPLPNGNVLILMKHNFTAAEIIEEGKDPSFSESSFVLDRLVELEPVGTSDANIVWEWNFVDHLVQDVDPGKPNYGIVADSPELVDVNYNSYNAVDFTHVNGIDYNENLDQIALSVRHLHEVMIIDHSTNTAEAASHSGGNFGKGGDILWRWGNPETYGQGTIDDRKLGLQHDSKWIEEGTYAGSISIFNNQDPNLSENSSIGIITPVIISNEYQVNTGKFEPTDFARTWAEDIMGTTFGTAKKSGVHILHNDHLLTMESIKGRITEVDENGDVVWVYVIPEGTFLNNQFDTPVDNSAFRATHYKTDYIGFTGHELISQGIIENVNSISEACVSSLDQLELKEFETQLYPNPSSNVFNISSAAKLINGKILSYLGQEVLDFNTEQVDLSSLSKGVYFVHLQFKEGLEVIRLIKN